MLKDYDSSAIVAVRDIDRARAFYSNVLGLELVGEPAEGMPLVYRTGATRLTVYASQEAGTNRANAVVWGVGRALDSIVAALEAKGVQFEHYPDIGTLDGNVHVVGPSPSSGRASARLVWFKDPDGNILHINSF